VTQYFDIELRKIEEQEKKFEEMQWENDNGNSSSGSKGNRIKTEEPDGPNSDEEIEDDSEEGGPLFILNDLREALGQRERRTVIAWKLEGESRRVVISCYSPQNA
jgi:hypothetical protein